MTAAPLKIGRYAVFDEIAAGGMAAVHLARQRGEAGFEKVVAVKRLHAPFARDPELQSAFVDEARHASRIRHPNVVPVLDVLREEGELLLVMELVVGVPLATLVAESRLAGARTPAPIAIAVIADVLGGLHAAHTAEDETGHPLRIVHRDVSPQNILVGKDGAARVVDFGIAKAIGRGQHTRGNQLKGKPAYMAPEQLRGEPVDPRTDVYAAGVVLWELLTGHRLFSGDNEHSLARKVLEKIVDAPSRIVPGLSPELDAVVLRALCRDPEGRFADAREFSEALIAVVPPASSSSVSDWVQGLAATRLAALTAQVRAVERAEPLAETAEPRPSWRGWPVMLALALVLVTGAAWLWVASPRRGVAVRAAATERPSASALAPRGVVEPRASAAPSLSTSAAASAPPPPTTSAARPPSRPSRDCDPPYVVDNEGFHHMKPECL